MTPLTRLLLLVSLILLVGMHSTGVAIAQGQQPTAIGIAVPGSAALGDDVTLQARLLGSSGPIAGARIDFAIPTTFLNTSADMVIRESTTDQDGLASATYQVRMSGQLTVKASFAGDDTYAPSEAAAGLAVAGSSQLYVQGAGVQVLGLSAGPASSQSGLHWALTGWPIAAILITVWSLYGTAVFFMGRIAASGEGA